jgi:hypothetical protein
LWGGQIAAERNRRAGGENWTVRKQRPDSQDLLALARREGHPISASTLGSWRQRGLLPTPKRSGGGRSLFLYPRGTDQQLRRLLHWRTRAGRLNLVAIALWVEGFPLGVGTVRDALLEFIAGWSAAVETILAKQPADESAPDAFARTLSRQRSRAPVPRLSRMRLVERERAYAYLVAVMLGLEGEAKGRSEDLPHVQRLFGLRRGHGGGLAERFPLDDLQGLGRLLLPNHAKPVIARASRAEMELVRRAVAVFVEWMPRLGPEMLADEPVKALDVLTLVREFAEPPAEVLALLIVVWLSWMQSKGPSEAELGAYIEALAPGAVESEFVAMLSTGGLSDALRGVEESG